MSVVSLWWRARSKGMWPGHPLSVEVPSCAWTLDLWHEPSAKGAGWKIVADH